MSAGRKKVRPGQKKPLGRKFLRRMTRFDKRLWYRRS